MRRACSSELRAGSVSFSGSDQCIHVSRTSRGAVEAPFPDQVPRRRPGRGPSSGAPAAASSRRSREAAGFGSIVEEDGRARAARAARAPRRAARAESRAASRPRAAPARARRPAPSRRGSRRTGRRRRTKSGSSNDSARSRSIVRGYGSSRTSSSGNAARASSSRVSAGRCTSLCPGCSATRTIEPLDVELLLRRARDARRDRRAAGRTRRRRARSALAPLEHLVAELDLVALAHARAPSGSPRARRARAGVPVTRKPLSVRNTRYARRDGCGR